MRTIRPLWLIAAFLSGMVFAMWAEDLILHTRENRLEFTAPRLHFLVGKPLDHLKNAVQVPFAFQATLWSGSHTHEFRKTQAEFLVSYDLWEEKFSVTKLVAPRKTQGHLTSGAAEAWCLQEMAMDVAGVPGSEPLWARLEIRAQEKATPLFGKGDISDSGISLTGLVEIFSRPAQDAQPHWAVETGPVTLDELRRTPGQ